MDRRLRVVSWNVRWCVGRAARTTGTYLASLDADLLLLQDLNDNGRADLLDPVDVAWTVRNQPAVADGEVIPPGRRRHTLIAGRSGTATAVPTPAGLPLPERVTIAEVCMTGWPALTAVSYYAPPGVSWGLAKPRQAVIVANWLRSQKGPIVLGADANTPAHDPVDATAIATHWRTGRRRLAGETGDDVLWGPSVIHGLRDAWRIWLEADASRTDGIPPLGPLAISHRTGVRTDRPGTPRRYDSIWVSNEIHVDHAQYLSEALDRGLSDHAPVLIDVTHRDASPPAPDAA